MKGLKATTEQNALTQEGIHLTQEIRQMFRRRDQQQQPIPRQIAVILLAKQANLIQKTQNSQGDNLVHLPFCT